MEKIIKTPLSNQLEFNQKDLYIDQVHGTNYSHHKKSERFDSYIFHGTGSKNEMKKFMNINHQYSICSQILDNNGHRQFFPFKSCEDCWS